ncbi:MAG TPA: tetratricopeptide repeat protein [Methylophilus sp.]|nr:tetratricopeptide repeat protein [Methylophilus sp.]
MISTQQETHDSVHAAKNHIPRTFAEHADATLDLLKGAIAHQQSGRLEQAESMYKQVLEITPSQPIASHHLGVLMFSTNRMDEGLNYFRGALETDPGEPQYWISYVKALMHLGQLAEARKILMSGIALGLSGEDVDELNTQICEHSQGASHLEIQKPNQQLPLASAENLAQAKKEYKRQLRHDPNQPALLTALANLELQQGNTSSAIARLSKSITLDAKQAQAWSLLGIAYTQQGLFQKAIDACQKSIELSPASPEAYVNLGNAQRALQHFEKAIESYEKAIALNPNNADVFVNLGHLCNERLNYVAAAACYQQALSIDPNDYEVQYACGLALKELKAHQEALNHFSQALKLRPKDASALKACFLMHLELSQLEQALAVANKLVSIIPSQTDAHLNLGVVLGKMGRLKEALQVYDRAIKLDPSNAASYANRGLILADMQRLDEAMQSYDLAIQLDSNWDNAYWNKALLYLLRGDYLHGWPLYEWRWKTILKDFYRQFPQPLWLGKQPIQGKTILVTSEQGFGDFLQFCRYIPILEAMGAIVFLEVPKPLQTVISSMHAGFTMVEAGNAMPETDYYCPMMSLPAALKTELSTIPNNVPYLFVDNEKKKRWLDKLGVKARPRIGLVFSGSTKHQNDHNRSIAFERLSPMVEFPAEFHLLQKEFRENDMPVIRRFDNVRLHQNDLTDFSDTAALIALMDLVISVDTSVAHLAAAMGKDCWVMLPYAPDFRWMLDREDSPWYPSVRLFRQPDFNDWESVVGQVKRKLEEIFVQ